MPSKYDKPTSVIGKKPGLFILQTQDTLELDTVQSLDGRVWRQNKLTLRQLTNLQIQITEALSFAYSSSIVNREEVSDG
jgi:hypothetical protein